MLVASILTSTGSIVASWQRLLCPREVSPSHAVLGPGEGRLWHSLTLGTP